MSVVISGFPAIGKTYLFNNSNLKVTDSDSSKFSWIEKGVRHPDFPSNYIRHIKECMGVYDIVLVSSHEEVRKALQEANIDYTLVYPNIGLKNEYIQRYKDRGNPESFINLIEANWDNWIEAMEEDPADTHLILSSGDYLSDFIQYIK